MNIHDLRIDRDAQGHDRSAAGLAQDLCEARRPRPTCACRCARSCSIGSRPASRRCRSTTPPAPYTDPMSRSTSRQGLARARIEWVKERGGVEEYDGRPIKPVDNGNVTGKHLARAFPNTPKPLRGAGRQAGHAARMGARRHHHQGDDLRRRAREPRPQAAARARRMGARRRRELRRLGAAVRDAGIRARRSRARPRHHPVATSTTPNSSRWRSAATS